MLWAPVEILRGAASHEQALALIGIQAVWVVIAWLSYATVWRHGLRQFSAVGA